MLGAIEGQDIMDTMLASVEGGRRVHQQRCDVPPLVSIITVVFQARHDLPPLMESVVRLKDRNAEWIIVDGGSCDGTRDFLREHDSDIDYWISESDRGIYDAMNKGAALARGTFLLHLNAGDRLLHLPIRELAAAKESGVDGAAFRVSIDAKYDFKPRFGVGLRLNNTLHHQGTFFRRESLPAYNISYKVFADFDLNQQLARRGSRITLFDQVVALHSVGGVSSTPSDSTIGEFFHVILKNYGWQYIPLAWIGCKWRGLNARLARMRERAT